MKLDGIGGIFYKASEIMYKLAFANILWILFTLLGLGVFGFIPSTVALFTIIRKWIMNDDVPFVSTFWTTFRTEFLKSNLLGLILAVIGLILYFDLTYLPSDGFFTMVRWGLIICVILYVITLLYIFPIYVHYDRKIDQYLKYALLVGASHPHYTLLMGVGIAGLYFILQSIPAFTLFFSFSGLAYIVMWVTYQVIKKIEVVQEEMKESK